MGKLSVGWNGWRTLLAVAVLIVAAAMPAAAQDERATAPGKGPLDRDEVAAFVDGIMAAHLRDKHIAGATISIVVDNQPFFAKGYGYADVAAGTPVSADETMFRIGSVSKLFTWTAVMQLAEQGKLDLDADINKYLVDFQIPATYPEPITLKHQLSHTPGFEDYVIGLFGRGPTDTPLGKLLAGQIPTRVRKPGELASYSNHGTAIAGYIVEQVSGMPWADYIEKHILEPLDMRNTTVRQPPLDKLPANLSKGYRWTGGRYKEIPFEYVPAAPAGSMSASAGDMSHFLIAHLQNGVYGDKRILQEDTARKMRELLFTHDPHLEGMAYGFMRMNYAGEQIVEHGGDTIAFHSFFVALPERKAGFFVSYNTTTAGSARNTLLQALMDRYYAPSNSKPPQPTADFKSRASHFPGQYGGIRHSYNDLAKIGALFSVADVSVDDDSVLFSVGNDMTLRFVETEPNVFRERDGQRMLAFRDNGQEPTTHMFLGGSPIAWVRLPWYETPNFNLLLIVGCVGVFASAVIGWPLAAFITRGSHGAVGRHASGSRAASWLGWITSLFILVILGLAMIPFSDSQEIAYGVPPLLNALIWTTPLIVALVVGAAVCAALSWKDHYWTISGRLHYLLVVIAGAAFVWFLYHWNLLGFGA